MSNGTSSANIDTQPIKQAHGTASIPMWNTKTNTIQLVKRIPIFIQTMHLKINQKELIKSSSNKFDGKTTTVFLNRYDSLLASGYKEYFKECHSHFSKSENALLLRLEGYKENYTAWVHDFTVPTTNNLSERSLRFIKIKDKVSGQFQNEAHAQYFARIRTYIETCKRNGVNEFQSILRLTSGTPYTLQELFCQSGA